MCESDVRYSKNKFVRHSFFSRALSVSLCRHFSCNSSAIGDISLPQGNSLCAAVPKLITNYLRWRGVNDCVDFFLDFIFNPKWGKFHLNVEKLTARTMYAVHTCLSIVGKKRQQIAISLTFGRLMFYDCNMRNKYASPHDWPNNWTTLYFQYPQYNRFIVTRLLTLRNLHILSSALFNGWKRFCFRFKRFAIFFPLFLFLHIKLHVFGGVFCVHRFR